MTPYDTSSFISSSSDAACVISDFRRDVDEIGALLGYYAALVVVLYRRFGTTYRFLLQGSRIKKTLEDGTDSLSRNVDKELALNAA
jgi:hypothetical protein